MISPIEYFVTVGVLGIFFMFTALGPGSVSPAEPVLKRLDQTNPKPVWNCLNWNIKEMQANHMSLKKIKNKIVKKLHVKRT